MMFQFRHFPSKCLIFLLLSVLCSACTDCAGGAQQMRGEGFVGRGPPIVEGKREESGGSWSTEWTQKPWSWSESWGGAADGRSSAGGATDWGDGTQPWTESMPAALPSAAPPQTKTNEEDTGTTEESAEGGGGQKRREGLLQRFCARHPDSAKCRGNSGGTEKVPESENGEGGGLMERFCARHPEHSKCNGGTEEGTDTTQQTPWHSTASPNGDFSAWSSSAGGYNRRPPSFHNFRPSFAISPNATDERPPTPTANVDMHAAQMDKDVKPEDPSLSFGFLSEEAREAMLKNCLSGAVDCKAQPFGMIQKRTMVLQHEMDFMRKVRPYQSGEMVQKRVEMVQKLKQKMLEVAGLDEHVQPVNDGTFQHDVLLTEKQSEELIKALNNVPKPAKKLHRYGYGHRFKRASLFLEQFAAQKWPIGQPIAFFFDPKIEEFEKQMVRQAHQMIEAQTCIRFRPSDSKPNSDFLYYIKVSTPTFCGLSYIGHVSPANPIYLSFQCQDPVGVAVHETMHALGANHEHLRADREEHLDIQWANINPQFYDFFAIADPSKFTSYGSAYAYDSIMHYGPFTATLDTSRPTMVPKKNAEQNMALMGQRKKLSTKDVELLNKMYCKQNCEDRNVYCGFWALRNFCQMPPQLGWMRQNCRKSCALC
ncbi:hypothetical protein niasHS_017594 [Heterodera schachtii]|uniref:Metalloendopeptidase n=1 Tax=Heterodera schachtii TaxID=97005 RepID=A0ABD2I428_HETSC